MHNGPGSVLVFVTNLLQGILAVTVEHTLTFVHIC